MKKQKNSKQRLFEVMGKLDKTFKPKLNESDEYDGEYQPYNMRNDRSGNLDRYGLPIESEREFDENIDVWLLYDYDDISFKKSFKLKNVEFEANKKYRFIADDASKEYIKDNEISQESFLPSMWTVHFNNIQMGYEEFLEFYNKNEEQLGFMITDVPQSSKY